MILTSTPVFADGIWLLNKQECNETKVGVGTALGMADYLFKEAEKNNNLQQAEEKRKSNKNKRRLYSSQRDQCLGWTELKESL